MLLLSNTILFNCVCGILSWNSYLYVFIHLNSLEILFRSLDAIKSAEIRKQTFVVIFGVSPFSLFCCGICFWHQMKVKSNDIGHKKTIDSCIVVVYSFSNCWFVLKISFSFGSAREKIAQFKKQLRNEFIKSFFFLYKL